MTQETLISRRLIKKRSCSQTRIGETRRDGFTVRDKTVLSMLFLTVTCIQRKVAKKVKLYLRTCIFKCNLYLLKFNYAVIAQCVMFI